MCSGEPVQLTRKLECRQAQDILGASLSLGRNKGGLT